MSDVEKGFNSDLTVRGLSYHVQTEDWGRDVRLIVTRVFRNGAVVKSFKTPYSEVLRMHIEPTVQALRLAMREQHQQTLDLLASDRL